MTDPCPVACELCASRERLALAPAIAEIGFWDVDLLTGVTEISDADLALFGLESPPSSVDGLAQNTHPEDRQRVREHWAQLPFAETPREVEFRVVRPDGSVRWLTDRAACFRDENGQPVRLMGVNRDITEQKCSALELERSQREFRTLVENLPDIVVRMDADLRITYASPRFSDFGRADCIGKTWAEAGVPRDAAALLAQEAASALNSGAERRFEFTAPLKGAPADIEARFIPEPHADRALTLLAILTDITVRKQVEAATRESDERLRSAFAHAATGIAISDNRGRLISVNDAYAALTGYPAAELIGRPVLDITHPDDVPSQRAAIREVLAGRRRSAVLEKRYVRKDGTVGWARNSISRQVTNGAVNLVGICEDITDRKRAEADRQRLQEELLQVQKMEAIARLAGGIAHDFNNLLTVILGYGAILRRKLSSDPELSSQVDEILASADRAASLTHQLLAFSRRQILQPRRINFNDELRGMQEMLAQLLGDKIRLKTELDPALGDVRADPGQIREVIMSLAANAREAMPAGGAVTIRTRNVAITNPQGEIRPGVALMITDTGCGMTDDVRKKIFDPFFTTKEASKGAGLGLATVLGIVEQSGGTIEVASEPGKGSTFTVRLPKELGSGRQEGGTHNVDGEVPAARILLVEDEPAVRRLAAKVLTSAGYRVLSAACGGAALEIAGSETIDLLLTDVVMPEMSGPDVAAAVHDRQPGVPVIFMSGFSEHEEIRRKAESGAFRASGFVAKPFSADKLLSTVAAALSSARAAAAGGASRAPSVILKPNAEQA